MGSPADPHLFKLDRAKGCLLGGAIGDALGAPVEFLSLNQIQYKYGPSGIRELDYAYGCLGAITRRHPNDPFHRGGFDSRKVEARKDGKLRRAERFGPFLSALAP